MDKRLSQDEILKHLADGWELGWSAGIGVANGRFWIQKDGLCAGGDSFDLNANTVRALMRKKKIKVAPTQKGDPYWLARYRLV